MKLGFLKDEKVENDEKPVLIGISNEQLLADVNEKKLYNTHNKSHTCLGTIPCSISWVLKTLLLLIFLFILWLSFTTAYGQLQLMKSSQEWNVMWLIQRPKIEVNPPSVEGIKFATNIETRPGSSCPFDIEDELKFDCYPQGDAKEDLCQQRGCCWSETEKQSVPFCYYPANYALYSFVNVTHLNGSRYNGVIGYLKQIDTSGYPEEVSLLKLVATFETRTRLHVKIVDAENNRYEVNVLDALQVEDETPVRDADYEFAINMDIPGFSVTRKSNGQVLFSTVGIGGFIYANQFLQISSFLPSGNIYGLGEHQDSLRHSTNWQRFSLFNHDTVPGTGRNLYGSHPFYLLMENDGLSHGVFLKNSDPIEVILQPTPAITFRVLGGVLDFYFFLGPTPDKVIQQYTEVIGRPAMPPYWGLGFHLCRFNYGSTNRTREIWERTREAGIPFDVQWNDIDYMDTAKDFTYDANKYAGLPDFVRQVHAAGMYYVPIIDPGISNAEFKSEYPPYDEGIAMGIFVKNSAEPGDQTPFVGKVWNSVSTVWPDFTHPNVTEYWTNQLRDFHNEVSFDGAWIDMNEPSNFYSGTIDGCPETKWDDPPYTPKVVGDKLCYLTLCMSAGQFQGIHYDVHNLYGLTETMATNFALKQITGKRPFIISRSTFPGQGHYGGHWSGDVLSDWTNLRRSITSILNYNMYGIPLVGADICGFNGNTTAALCQRWMELGAFYPFARNHNTDDAIDQDPVALGPAVVESSKKALKIRYMLLPYLYTLFWHAHAHGTTVARPLFFEFPSDRQTYTIDTQFLWGPGLMVAPVLTEATVFIEVYLPRSLWYDFYSLQLISVGGGKWTGIPAPLDTIPLMLRGGHVLPTQAPEVTTSLTRVKPFDLLVALNETEQAAGDLYWDDGVTIDAYILSRFSYIQFEAAFNMIRSTVVNWNNDAQPSNVRDITIVGLNHDISVVSVNGISYSSFTYNSNKKVLFIKDLQLSLKNPFVINFISDSFA